MKWIGRRRIDLTAHPRPETVAPIRIRRGAFADNMPHTDLLVSPDHAIFVDGRLICARQLINGTTIRQEKGWTAVEYFHVELDAHAILLAEGLPAESYLNTGNRGFFANSGDPLVLHPDLTDETDYPTREAGSCAPFVWDEGSVRPVWQRLAERAAALGQPAPQPDTTTDPELRIVAKGRTVRPLYGENGLYIFALPKGATEVRLVSRAGAPTDARPWLEDRRCLGVYVERILLRGASEMREVPLDHPALSQGWWAVERDGSGAAPVDRRRGRAAAAGVGWPDDAGDPRQQRRECPTWRAPNRPASSPDDRDGSAAEPQTFSTCPYSSSTGVERPKIETLTFTRPFSSSTSSTVPLKLVNGPSATRTCSPTSYSTAGRGRSTPSCVCFMMRSASASLIGRGPRPAAQEAGHLRRVLHQVPGVIGQLHLHQHIAGEELVLRVHLLAAAHLDHLLRRHQDLIDLVRQALLRRLLLDLLGDLLFEARVDVHHVPTLGHCLNILLRHSCRTAHECRCL